MTAWSGLPAAAQASAAFAAAVAFSSRSRIWTAFPRSRLPPSLPSSFPPFMPPLTLSSATKSSGMSKETGFERARLIRRVEPKNATMSIRHANLQRRTSAPIGSLQLGQGRFRAVPQACQMADRRTSAFSSARSSSGRRNFLNLGLQNIDILHHVAPHAMRQPAASTAHDSH